MPFCLRQGLCKPQKFIFSECKFLDLSGQQPFISSRRGAVGLNCSWERNKCNRNLVSCPSFYLLRPLLFSLFPGYLGAAATLEEASSATHQILSTSLLSKKPDW